jgi:hypothetical protein
VKTTVLLLIVLGVYFRVRVGCNPNCTARSAIQMMASIPSPDDAAIIGAAMGAAKRED